MLKRFNSFDSTQEIVAKSFYLKVTRYHLSGFKYWLSKKLLTRISINGYSRKFLYYYTRLEAVSVDVSIQCCGHFYCSLVVLSAKALNRLARVSYYIHIRIHCHTQYKVNKLKSNLAGTTMSRHNVDEAAGPQMPVKQKTELA